MRMTYRILADLVAIVHLAFILFVVIGGVFVLRWPQLGWIHVPAAVWGVVIELKGWMCPLTSLENALLRKAGLSGYDGGFVAHYIFALIYPDGLTRAVELAIGIFVLVVNVGVYGRLLTR